MAVKGKQTDKHAYAHTKVTKLNDYFPLLQQHVCLCLCALCVCCYGRVNLFLCSKDCWAIFIINHVSYAEQTDIVLYSFSIPFCWNVNEFHLLLSLYIKIELSTSTHTKREEKTVYEWIERKVNHHHDQVTAEAWRNRVFTCVCLCIELSKNDIKAEYLIELKITWPQTMLILTMYGRVYIVRANNILIECLHALNCNYVASFLLRVVGETKTINCLFAVRLFRKESKWWLTIV